MFSLTKLYLILKVKCGKLSGLEGRLDFNNSRCFYIKIYFLIKFLMRHSRDNQSDNKETTASLLFKTYIYLHNVIIAVMSTSF